MILDLLNQKNDVYHTGLPTFKLNDQYVSHHVLARRVTGFNDTPDAHTKAAFYLKNYDYSAVVMTSDDPLKKWKIERTHHPTLLENKEYFKVMVVRCELGGYSFARFVAGDLSSVFAVSRDTVHWETVRSTLRYTKYGEQGQFIPHGFFYDAEFDLFLVPVLERPHITGDCRRRIISICCSTDLVEWDKPIICRFPEITEQMEAYSLQPFSYGDERYGFLTVLNHDRGKSGGTLELNGTQDIWLVRSDDLFVWNRVTTVAKCGIRGMYYDPTPLVVADQIYCATASSNGHHGDFSRQSFIDIINLQGVFDAGNCRNTDNG